MNNRRKLIVAFGASAHTVPFASYAQQPGRIRRIGLLSPYAAADSSLWYEAFRQGLREFGWIEGKSISIEYRYADGKRDRIPDLMADLVGLKVDVVVTAISTEVLTAQKAAKAIPPIPVVTAAWSDPLASGMVESMAHPAPRRQHHGIVANEL